MAVSAGRHGRRAAVLDHGLKSAIPADRSHDVWTLDEFELPIFVRAYDPSLDAEVVVKPQIVLVMDHCSRAIISCHLVPAFGDLGDGVGPRHSATASTEDILGAVWSAALKELAPEATQAFAGYLPRILRMDNATSHRQLRDAFQELGIEVPRLPTYQPAARGDIERLFRTFKAELPDLQGLTQHYYVAENATEHPAQRRSRNVGVGRSTVRAPIAMQDLLTIAELQPHLDALVAQYNTTSHDGLGQLTPRHAYINRLPVRAARRVGLDLLSTRERHAVTLRRGGLVVRKQRFRTVDPAQMPPMGALCHLVMDPLRRGAWWMDCTPPRFLLRTEDAAKSPQVLEGHIEAREVAARASDDAAEARAAHLAELTGDPDAPGRAAAALDAALQARKTEKKNSRANPARKRSARATTPASTAPAVPRVPPPIAVPSVRPSLFTGFTVPRSV